MIDLTGFITFITASVILIITPGPNMLYIISRSIRQGRREGVVSALGIATGAIIHILAAVIGLSTLSASIEREPIQEHLEFKTVSFKRWLRFINNQRLLS